MNLKMLPLLMLWPFACTNDASIDFATTQTGIYEAHTEVLEDSCTWIGSAANYDSAPWLTGIFVDRALGSINLPFAEREGTIQRYDIFEEEDFALDTTREQECGAEDQKISVVALADETVITQRRREWVVEEDCETEVNLLPDTSCSTVIEQVMYLDESCEAPCEIKLMPGDAPACVCE